MGAKFLSFQAFLAWILCALPFSNLSGIIRFVTHRKVSAFDYLSILFICYSLMNALYFNLHIQKLSAAKTSNAETNTQAPPGHALKSEQVTNPGRPIVQSVNYSKASPKRSSRITPELEEKIKKANEIERLAKINIEHAPPISENTSSIDDFLCSGGKMHNDKIEEFFEGKVYDGPLAHENTNEDIRDVKEIQESTTPDHLQADKQQEIQGQDHPGYVNSLIEEAPFERGKSILNKQKQGKYMG